ncbi:polysaccharide biosynthesis protein, partial [Candidatus Frankia alpina]
MAKPSREAVSGLLAGPAALAVAGMLVNGCNLLMNLIVARALDSDSYGAVSVQVSIFLILSVAGNALLIAVVQHETSGTGDTRREQWSWIRQLRGACGVGIVVATVVALVLSRPAAALMSYPHPVAIAEATIGAALWTLLCVERGLMQARGAYQRLAVNFVVEGFARIG